MSVPMADFLSTQGLFQGLYISAHIFVIFDNMGVVFLNFMTTPVLLLE